ncbi:MAG: triose-phosphate isomerase [Vicingaceae bacterium]|nr:triose-phosphate isomerase [Vicingaceae bacterium]
MRKKIVAGNWKMNKSFEEAKELVGELVYSEYNNDVEMIIIPPALYVSELIGLVSDSDIKVGVQNSSNKESGAFTGELSASMVNSVGANYGVVGHSERREYFGEQNDILAQKVSQLLTHNITPIYCCGEVLEDRENENHFALVKSQIVEGLFHLSDQELLKCVVAYEPVWAIGTGVTASSSQAQEMHSFVRDVLAENYGNEVAQNISILYGGSCKPSNAKELFACTDVDGGLIGGASLVAKDFVAIANSF